MTPSSDQMNGWFEHFHLSADPFSEDTPSWTFFYGGRYGIASLKLEQALERKRGLIVVSGPPGSGKSALVRSALARLRVFASATVSAAQIGPASVIDVLLRSREPGDGGFSVTRKRAALITMIEQARASGRAIVCVIEDAHHARPGQIKDLMTAIETAPNASSVFQVVLVGRPPLQDSMRARALGDLRARTTATVETTPLSPGEIGDFLTERLESVDCAMPDAILPPVAIAAIAHHSRGVLGLAAALARSSLERAAENGVETVSVEIVDEVASLYGALPGEPAHGGIRRTAARAFALGAVASLVVLALTVAAAEVQLLGSGGRRIRANVEALRSLAGFGQMLKRSTHDGEAEAREPEAQPAVPVAPPILQEPQTPAPRTGLGTPREEFLGASKSAPESKPYEVNIKPPQRPESALVPGAPASGAGTWEETHVEAPTSSGETVITVPGIPGPLVPRPASSPTIRSSDTPPQPRPAAPTAGPRLSTPPATDTAAARNAAPSAMELESGPRIALQVGAFRERESADALKDKLARQFDDVYVSMINSGGEPLFRVRVGKFRSPDESTPMREKLQAAGYASFRVTEP